MYCLPLAFLGGKQHLDKADTLKSVLRDKTQNMFAIIFMCFGHSSVPRIYIKNKSLVYSLNLSYRLLTPNASFRGKGLQQPSII